MHLVDEQIQRALHDELTPSAAADVRAHLSECAACRDRMARSEDDDRWIFDRLRTLDHSTPDIRAGHLIRAARMRRAPGWGRWAAGIFLALALGGVAYAAPGSPLPGMLARLVQSIDPSPGQGAAPAVPERQPAAAGIAVPAGDRLSISFSSASPGDTAVISISDASDVIVRAQGGTTSFASGPDRLTVEHRGGPARFDILLPRAARLVDVDVAGRRIVRKDHSRIIVRGVSPDSVGRYVIPLALP